MRFELEKINKKKKKKKKRRLSLRNTKKKREKKSPQKIQDFFAIRSFVSGHMKI